MEESHHCPHFTDEKTEAQINLLTEPVFESWPNSKDFSFSFISTILEYIIDAHCTELKKYKIKSKSPLYICPQIHSSFPK